MSEATSRVKEQVNNSVEKRLEEQIQKFSLYALEKPPTDFKDDPGFIYVLPANGEISEGDPKRVSYACRANFANEVSLRLDFIIKNVPKTGFAASNVEKIAKLEDKKTQFLELYILKEGFGENVPLRIGRQGDLDKAKRLVQEMVEIVNDLDR